MKVMLYGLPSDYRSRSQDRTHLSTAKFMSKAIILPVSTWNTYNILSTLTSLPKEVLLWTRILLVALHMWCLPPSATWRGISVTITLIPEKVLIRSWLNYNSNMLNVTETTSSYDPNGIFQQSTHIFHACSSLIYSQWATSHILLLCKNYTQTRWIHRRTARKVGLKINILLRSCCSMCVYVCTCFPLNVWMPERILWNLVCVTPDPISSAYLRKKSSHQ
jgi:hypothetical protein